MRSRPILPKPACATGSLRALDDNAPCFASWLTRISTVAYYVAYGVRFPISMCCGPKIPLCMEPTTGLSSHSPLMRAGFFHSRRRDSGGLYLETSPFGNGDARGSS